jgi:hypothetical protein
MKTTALNQFKKYRQELTKLRSNLQSQIDEIDEALGIVNNGHYPSQPAQSVQRRARRSNQKNAMSLREAITQVTSRKALTKQEIIDAVGKLGYRFSTSDPAGSVNALLYSKHGKEHFKNQGGKFSVR